CCRFGWEAGGLWLIDRQQDLFRCVQIWQEPSMQIPGFTAECMRRNYSRGAWPRGQARSTGSPSWIEDAPGESDSLGAGFAACGLREAFAFPIRLEGNVIGGMEFYSSK